MAARVVSGLLWMSVGRFSTADDAPSFFAMEPDAGSFFGGTVVTITGFGFSHVERILFGTTICK